MKQRVLQWWLLYTVYKQNTSQQFKLSRTHFTHSNSSKQILNKEFSCLFYTLISLKAYSIMYEYINLKILFSLNRWSFNNIIKVLIYLYWQIYSVFIIYNCIKQNIQTYLWSCDWIIYAGLCNFFLFIFLTK